MVCTVEQDQELALGVFLRAAQAQAELAAAIDHVAQDLVDRVLALVGEAAAPRAGPPCAGGSRTAPRSGCAACSGSFEKRRFKSRS